MALVLHWLSRSCEGLQVMIPIIVVMADSLVQVNCVLSTRYVNRVVQQLAMVGQASVCQQANFHAAVPRLTEPRPECFGPDAKQGAEEGHDGAKAEALIPSVFHSVQIEG